MKRFYCCFVIFIFAFIFIAPPSASAFLGIEAAVGMWRQDINGDFALNGTSLNVGNDLGYDAKYNVFGRVKIDMPLIIPNIYLMASPASFEADGIKDVNFKFGDNTFTGSVPFHSKLQMYHYDVALYYSIPFLQTATTGMLNVEGGIDARIFDVKAELEQASTGLSASKNFILPIPMLYLAAQVKPVKFLNIEAEARGITYSCNYYYDLIFRVKVKPYGPVFVAGGYRYEGLSINQNEIDAKLSLGGPFLEAGFVF